MTEEKQAKLNKQLLEAAANGNIEEVKTLIAAGADVNTSNDKTTPLYYAVGEGHTTIVNKLIAAGADVNFVDGSSQTHLHMAARFGYIEAARALIAAGADVNALNSSEKTPLDNAKDVSDEFYNQFIDAIAIRINNDTEKAIAFKMGNHDRLGKESKLNNLNTDLFDMIIKNVTSVRMTLDDIQEEDRKAVEEQLNKSQEKHVDSHAEKVAAGRSSNNPSQGRS